MLGVLALAGRRVLEPLRRARLPRLQQAVGAMMAATAILMDDLRRAPRYAAVPAPFPALRGRRLPRLGRAPELTGTQRWFNTAGGRPLTLRSLRGRVVLIDFWTYTCINCIRTLPCQGLDIVGVHSPEFGFEKDAGNVARAIRADGLRYPVVQDNDLATWYAWSNVAWPAEYLVGADGQVRHVHIGEGDYPGSERAIRALLAEAGARRLGAVARPRGTIRPSRLTTPETYVGSARAERFGGPLSPAPTPTRGSRRRA